MYQTVPVPNGVRQRQSVQSRGQKRPYLVKLYGMYQSCTPSVVPRSVRHRVSQGVHGCTTGVRCRWSVSYCVGSRWVGQLCGLLLQADSDIAVPNNQSLAGLVLSVPTAMSESWSSWPVRSARPVYGKSVQQVTVYGRSVYSVRQMYLRLRLRYWLVVTETALLLQADCSTALHNPVPVARDRVAPLQPYCSPGRRGSYPLYIGTPYLIYIIYLIHRQVLYGGVYGQ